MQESSQSSVWVPRATSIKCYRVSGKKSNWVLSQLFAFSNTIRHNNQRDGLVRVRYSQGKGISLPASARSKIRTRFSDVSCCHLTTTKKKKKKRSHLRYLLAIVPDHHTISVKYEVPGRGSIERYIRKNMKLQYWSNKAERFPYSQLFRTFTLTPFLKAAEWAENKGGQRCPDLA